MSSARNLPYLTEDLPGIGGTLRTCADDFVVDEIPAYPPGGEGDHVFVTLEKRELDTPGAIRAVATALDIDPRDIGYAGLKDRMAVTRQQLSLPPPVTPEQVEALTVARIQFLSVARHPHKLKTGHLKGNRFRLVVRDLAVTPEQAVERALAILERLSRPPGCPNWFGNQRFGSDRNNAAAGRALVDGTSKRRPKGRQKRFLISAYQSHLFNEVLRQRLEENLLGTALAGDILMKRESGGSFVCSDVATDQARLDAGELVTTGPMFGHKVRLPPEGTAAFEREQRILEAEGIEPASFRPLGKLAFGTRRALAVQLTDTAVEATGDGVAVSFALPPGSYATAVMRELLKGEEPFPD